MSDIRIYHKHRREYGTVVPMTSAPDTTWVVFDGETDPSEVSRDQLERVKRLTAKPKRPGGAS